MSTYSPTVSIITVVYNGAGTVTETLASVRDQSYQAIEHIVVDGNSTDETVERVRKFASPGVRLISEPDRGIYDAMNKGIGLASGEIIAFLGADDVYAHAAVVETVVRYMQERNVDAVLGDVGFFRPAHPERIVRRYDSGRFTPARIAWGWMPAHTAMFLRKDVYTRVGSFRTDYRIAGDYEFIARAFWKGQIRYVHLPQVLVKMRLGGISTGGLRNTILLNQEVLRACRENGIPTNIFKILSKYPAKFLEYLKS